MQLKFKILVITAIGLLFLTIPTRAQDTNAPRTKLELFESQIGRVIIRANTDIGSVTVKNGTVSIKSKESVDPISGHKEYGVAIRLALNDTSEDTTIIDYDELDSFLGGVDYISKVDWTVTPLPNFNAVYITRGDLRIATYGSRRTGTIEGALLSNTLAKIKVSFSLEQLAQLRVLFGQAKTALDSLRTAK